MDQQKFANAVLYLLEHTPGRPGRMQLLKMLFFADYEHYRRFLAPVTGAQYVALPDGPVVDDYRRVFEDLVASGYLDVREIPVSGHINKKVEYLARRPPDLSVFGPSELQVLGEVVREHGRASGVALSEKSHLQGPWSLVWDPQEQGRPIPYSLFRWYDNLPDEDDIEAARQLIVDRGLKGRVDALNQRPAAQ